MSNMFILNAWRAAFSLPPPQPGSGCILLQFAPLFFGSGPIAVCSSFLRQRAELETLRRTSRDAVSWSFLPSDIT